MKQKQMANYVNECIVWEPGFIYESNTIKAHDICLDMEQNICSFQIHPNESSETVLVYIGKRMFLCEKPLWC